MIADGHVLVVRQQGIVGAHHPADVGGVMHGRVEVGVVAHRRRHEHVRVGLRHQERSDAVLDLVSAGRVGIEQREDRVAQGRPVRAPAGHERIERRFGAGASRVLRRARDQAGVRTGGHVENQAADRHADARRVAASAPGEHAEGQVLDRELVAGLGRGGHPAQRVRVVRMVDHGGAAVFQPRPGVTAAEASRVLRVPKSVRQTSTTRTTGRGRPWRGRSRLP